VDKLNVDYRKESQLPKQLLDELKEVDFYAKN